MTKKYLIIILAIFDFGLSKSFAQAIKKEATLDDIKQDSIQGSLVLQDFTTGENFNDKDIFTKESGTEEYIIPDESIPKVRTQDGTPLCQTFCPTALAEFQYCKQKEITNCRDLPSSDRISPISTLKFRDNVDNEIKASIGSLATSGNRNTYEVMNSISSASIQTFFSEGCAPFDQVAKNFNNNAVELEQFRLSIKSKFESVKTKLNGTEANVSSCPECLELLNLINKGFNSKTDFNGLAKAIKKDEFNNFLFHFLFEQQSKINPNCKKINFEQRITTNYYPTSSEPYTPIQKVFEKATEQLKKKNPVILSSICFAKSKAKDECASHCMVLTGQKTVKNKNTGEVIELIKVHNSWDQKWQDDNSGGWIRADKLKSLVRTADDQKITKPPAERKDAFRFTISWFE